MATSASGFGWKAGNLLNALKRFGRNRAANVAMSFALLSPVLMGSLGAAFETAYWYMDRRNMQNAADAGALAAATDGTTNYQHTASAVANQYGYTDGANNTTVTSTNGVTCPGTGATNCYQVTVTYKQPLYLLPLLGFSGNSTAGTLPAQSLTASAIATPTTTDRTYCILALNTIGTTLTANGTPNANLSGCSTMSNASATCHGTDLGADYGDAHITDSGCGAVQTSNVPVLHDPYASLASNIPPDPCGSFPQEPSGHGGTALPAGNQWTGAQNLSGNVTICGDLQLTGNVTINAPSNAVLIIENGQLDTNGYTIQTSSGSALTVVFSGDNSSTYTHAPTGGGHIDIQAPTSGPWSGVALYQDPSLTSGVDIADAGNTPTWDISGLVYLPHSNVTFSGAVNKSSNGAACFAMVVGDITINGTGSIAAHGGCQAAGLTLPTNQIPGRGQLVY